MSSHALFDESLRCLSAHCHPEWGDRHPFDVFTRLLAKNVRPAGWAPNTHLDIKPDQVSSRREQWTTAALGKLVRGHGSTAGQDFHCPIIIAEYYGVQCVLDGNHRINRWVDARDTEFMTSTFTRSAPWVSSLNFLRSPKVPNNTLPRPPKGILWVRAARAQRRRLP